MKRRGLEFEKEQEGRGLGSRKRNGVFTLYVCNYKQLYVRFYSNLKNKKILKMQQVCRSWWVMLL